jgi:hypothetical protein
MRGFACFLAYTVGVSAVISLFIVSLMALESPIRQMPSAQIRAVTSNKQPVVTTVKPSNVTHKKERTSQKQKHMTARVGHEGTRELFEGHDVYGFVAEPRPNRSEAIFHIRSNQ